MKTTAEQNKRLVLEAFDTLFNKRDYAAAEKFWSPHYIQHTLTSSRAAKDCSIWSKPCRRRSSTSPARLWPTETS
jgi:hypothetical protein